jgi:hypothetical protein
VSRGCDGNYPARAILCTSLPIGVVTRKAPLGQSRGIQRVSQIAKPGFNPFPWQFMKEPIRQRAMAGRDTEGSSPTRSRVAC